MNMIDELSKANLITLEDEKNFTYAIFKRHHDKPFVDIKQKIEAQKRNALQYYYRNKLIKMYNQFKIKKIQK